MSKQFNIRKVDHGWIAIIDPDTYKEAHNNYKTFDELVQDLAYQFGQRKIDEVWVTYVERDDGK